MARKIALGWLALAAVPLFACGGGDGSTPDDSTGGRGSGGHTGNNGGSGAPMNGGSSNGQGGASLAGSNGAGGSPATGGAGSSGAQNGGANAGATGGSNSSAGGKASGGANATTGGTNSSGNNSGGTNSGGNNSGGSNIGGKASGGMDSGGKANGGASSGGTTNSGMGGSGTGGSGTSGGTAGTASCDWSDPPANVAAWINESWNAQLGGNIKNRKTWLLDNVMLGKGQLNLCVRWGATTPPSTTVKTGMASAVQKWFNDWFSQLNGYGCFPYPSVTVKVTGWAVKPGNTSWVSDLDSSIKVYTETDSGGEPICPEACSFFSNPSHKFPNCPGGEAFHTDYWMWIDQTLDGADAVGGDWGLRMPVDGFVTAMTKNSAYDTNTIEHEMGHGFGFQDYYDWTGSKPAGGSLMIIEPPLPPTPTIADRWLLRRTWKEAKALRGW